MGLGAVAPTSPGHWPLHLASSLKRPGREKPPLPHTHRAAYSMASSPYRCCSSARLVILPTVALSACAGRLAWQGWSSKTSRDAGFSGCMSVHPLHSRREPRGGDGSITSMCCPWFCLAAGCTRRRRSPDSMDASAVASSWWLGITV